MLSKSDIRVAIGACQKYADVLTELGGIERPIRFSRWAIRSGRKEAVVPSIAIIRSQGTNLEVTWAGRSEGYVSMESSYDRRDLIDNELNAIAQQYAEESLDQRSKEYSMDKTHYALCPYQMRDALQKHLSHMGEAHA